MTVGLLFVVLWYMAALSSPIRSLARLTTILGNAAASGDRLNEVLSSRETVPETSEAPVLPTPRQHIVFRDVSFSYIPGRPVLREVDLEIKTGSTLCIVGPAGAGKSTLLSLLLRLYDPDSGSIEVDGADLRSFDLRSIRERFALVPDEPSIFDGSILDNIAMGRPGASRADLHEAARSSLVASFADRLPGGLGARVGEGGVMLSGGQRRRLAMARALVRQAPVLLMDEPTSGLDVEAEAQIMTEVRGASRTVVVVTSSMYLTQHADQVVVLDDGSVVEAGEPAQLRQGAGHYAHLCDRYLPQPEVRHASSEAAIDGQQPTPSTVC
jgi:ATP-binding cassette subfamily B protein